MVNSNKIKKEENSNLKMIHLFNITIIIDYEWPMFIGIKKKNFCI